MKLRTRLLSILLITIMILGYMQVMSFAASDIVASGTCGTCDWVITGYGTLTISAGEMDDWGNSPPWSGFGLDLREINITGRVVLKTGRGMFSYCSKIKSLDLSNLDSAAVTDWQSVFYGCGSLTSIDLSNFNTTNVTNMKEMFTGCSGLTSLDVSKFDTSNVTDMREMFAGCSGLTSLDVRNFDTSNVTDMGAMFRNCNRLTSLDVSKFDTSNVTKMDYIFSRCSGLTSLDVRNFDTSNVTNMDYMFNHCIGLKSLDVSKFNTSNVTGMSGMFDDCTGFTNINLSSFNTSNVTDMDDMFSGCSGLTSLDVSKFDTSNVTDMGGMFSGCSGLTSLDVSKFDTSNVTYMGGMFSGCRGLTSLDVSNFDTTKVYSMEEMFCDCSGLTSIDLSNFDFTDYANLHIMFDGCDSLMSLKVGKNINMSEDFKAYFPVQMRDIDTGIEYASGAEIPQVSYHTFVATSSSEQEDIPDAQLLENIEGTINKTGSLSFDFDETSFSNDSRIYNHTMGRAAAALSLLAYNKSKNILVNVLEEQMGFRNIYTWDDNMQDDTGLYSPYMIGHKKVKLNGEKTELVIVVIRGTYQKEWLDDFDSGDKDSVGSVHEGFGRAEIELLDGLREYMSNSKYGFDKNAKMKILVTGHSRGAAVANLLGKDLDDGKLNTDKLTPIDVFVYTFATPNTAVLSDTDKHSFKNIINIVNPEDFVTKVIPSAWKYGRYGKTYVLPSKTTDPWESYTWGQKNHYVDYDDYLIKVKSGFLELNGDGEYVPYPNGERDLAEYVWDVTKAVSTIHEYYYKNLMTGRTKEVDADPAPYSLHDLYRNALGGNRSGDSEMEALSYAYMADAVTGVPYGGVGHKTIKFFFENQTDFSLFKTKKRFAAAHMGETYYSAMNVLSEEELKQPRKVLVGEAHCPVDVTIKDAEGNVIGQIVDNEVNESASVDNTAVLMTVEGEAKRFSIPEEADYTIEITGNGSGTMDYSLREEDPDTGEIKRVYYQDVPVTTSTVLTQTITDSTDVEERDLVDNEGNVVEPSAVMENGGIGDLSVEVTIEGKGAADSMYNLNLGDYVTLQAVADEYNEFLGWYDSEGQLISIEAEYGISMRENVALTAKFTDNEKPDEPGSTPEPEPTPTPTPVPSVTPAPQAPAEIQDLPAVKMSKPAAAKKSVNVKWKKVNKKNLKKIQGIEIQVATDSGFTDIVKTATAGKKKTSKKIKGLISKQTYYVRIRAYKDAADGKHVSAWKAKKVKVK